MLFCFVGFFFFVCFVYLINMTFNSCISQTNNHIQILHFIMSMLLIVFLLRFDHFFLSVSFFSPVDLQHTKHQHIYCFMLKWCCWNVINFYWEECPFCSQWKCHKTALWLTNISANNLTDLKMSLLCSSAL